ncbi:MAG: hypothetical protein MHM6MM_005719 [Cercozoa sp. M6MM]
MMQGIARVSTKQVRQFARNAPMWRKVKVTADGAGWQCITHADKHKIVTDEPAAAGGADEGPTPLHTALAALTGCSEATAFSVSKNVLKLDLQKIEFDVEAKWDARAWIGKRDDNDNLVPAHFQHVKLVAKVTTPASQEQVDELASLVHQRCPIAAMFRQAATVEEQWIKVDPQ